MRAPQSLRGRPASGILRPWNRKTRAPCASGLTPPSSGRSKGRFAPFGSPLTSNVRPRNRNRAILALMAKHHRHKSTPKLSTRQQPVPVLGASWYTESEWSAVKAAAADPELFERSFAEWVAMAEEALERMRLAGIEPRRVLVKSNELLAWCLVHNKPNNSSSRAEFVAEQMRIQSEGGA